MRLGGETHQVSIVVLILSQSCLFHASRCILLAVLYALLVSTKTPFHLLNYCDEPLISFLYEVFFLTHIFNSIPLGEKREKFYVVLQLGSRISSQSPDQSRKEMPPPPPPSPSSRNGQYKKTIRKRSRSRSPPSQPSSTLTSNRNYGK